MLVLRHPSDYWLVTNFKDIARLSVGSPIPRGWFKVLGFNYKSKFFGYPPYLGRKGHQWLNPYFWSFGRVRQDGKLS